MSDVTRILDRVQQGDSNAAEELLPLVYDELRNLAARRRAGEAAGHTLQPTALVHEVWLRLVRTPDQTWQNRAHFFRTAAECMRRILIDHARRKQQVRRQSSILVSSRAGRRSAIAPPGRNHFPSPLAQEFPPRPRRE